EKLVNRRGAAWWDGALRKGSRISVLAFGDQVAGYANYGRNRARSLFYDGEIYELYLKPEFQGLGFGRRLFTAPRRDLAQSGMKSLVIWALSDNEPAVEFYRALGGKAGARSSERFGDRVLDKVAFAWQGRFNKFALLFVVGRHADRTGLTQHNPLVLAALEAARVLVGDLSRELVGVGIGARVDIADMADAAGTEPRDNQHTTGRIDRVLAFRRLVAGGDDVPAQNGRERTQPAIRRFFEPPLDRAGIDVVERRERLRLGEILLVVLLRRAERDEHALIAGGESHRDVAVT